MAFSLVIVDDLNLMRVAAAPYKADSPSIVDSDAVLAFAISLQSFEPVAAGNRQVGQSSRKIDLLKLTKGHALNRPETLHGFAFEEKLRFFGPK
jgi:hypothetical protein